MTFFLWMFESVTHYAGVMLMIIAVLFGVADVIRAVKEAIPARLMIRVMDSGDEAERRKLVEEMKRLGIRNGAWVSVPRGTVEENQYDRDHTT